MFLTCLGLSAAVLGYFAHDIISSSETELAEQQYESIVDRALDAAQRMTLRKARGSKSMATILSRRFPNRQAWPFVALEGYEEIAADLMEASNGSGMGFCPLVQPGEELTKFEKFAYDYFDATYGPDHTIGVHSFGTGVYGLVNSTTKPFLDRDGRFFDARLGTYTNASKYVYLAPMLQLNKYAPILMRNIRNDRGRGVTIDRMMDCFYRQQQQKQLATWMGAKNDNTTSNKDCGVISSFKLSRTGEPAAFVYQPIHPANSSQVSKQIHLCLPAAGDSSH